MPLSLTFPTHPSVQRVRLRCNFPRVHTLFISMHGNASSPHSIMTRFVKSHLVVRTRRRVCRMFGRCVCLKSEPPVRHRRRSTARLLCPSLTNRLRRAPVNSRREQCLHHRTTTRACCRPKPVTPDSRISFIALKFTLVDHAVPRLSSGRATTARCKPQSRTSRGPF